MSRSQLVRVLLIAGLLTGAASNVGAQINLSLENSFCTGACETWPLLYSEAVALGDIDANGTVDLAVLVNNSEAPGVVKLYLREPNGTLQPPIDFPYSIPFPDPLLGEVFMFDLENDGDLDLVAFVGGLFWVAANDGALNFDVQTYAIPAGWTWNVTRGDLDADGDVDFLLAQSQSTASGQVVIFENDGAGAFTPSILDIDFARGMAFGDMNGDGLTDLVVAEVWSVDVYLGGGGTSFAPTPLSYGFSGGTLLEIELVDVDGDGNLDVVSAASTSSLQGMLVLFGDGTGALGSPVETPVADSAFDFLVTDLDLDGNVDCVYSYPGSALLIYAGDGTGAFALAATFSDIVNPHGFDVADITGDGIPDLVTASLASDLVGEFLSGPFGAPFVRGDVNVDGAVDIADAVGLLDALFIVGDPLVCDLAGDANDDNLVDVSDPIAVLAFLFGVSAPLPEPSATCGADPTPGVLSCVDFGACP